MEHVFFENGIYRIYSKDGTLYVESDHGYFLQSITIYNPYKWASDNPENLPKYIKLKIYNIIKKYAVVSETVDSWWTEGTVDYYRIDEGKAKMIKEVYGKLS